MKKIILGIAMLALAATFFTSCDKLSSIDEAIELLMNATESDAVASEELPTDVTEYTDDNFFETFIKKAFQISGAGYRVDCGSGDQLFFDEDGNPIELSSRGRKRHGHHHACGERGDRLDVTDLPAAITSYIATNYPNDSIHRAKKMNDKFFVGLSSHTVLVFDADGNFLEEATFGHHPCKGDLGTELTLTDLPQTVQQYIAANYASASFHKAFKDKEDNGFIVVLKDGTQATILGFDSTGNFLFVRIKD